jgi:hypothetical protein
MSKIQKSYQFGKFAEIFDNRETALMKIYDSKPYLTGLIR